MAKYANENRVRYQIYLVTFLCSLWISLGCHSGELLEPNLKLRPITASELEEAYRGGRKIVSRKVNGVELRNLIVKLRDELSIGREDDSCSAVKPMLIESSYIEGGLGLGDVLKNGPIELFPDDFRKPFSYEKTIGFPIAITKSRLTGPIVVKETDFLCDFDISESVFEGSLRFEYSRFRRLIAIGATFKKEFTFSRIALDENGNFSDTKFQDVARFVGPLAGYKTVYKSIGFDDAVFFRKVQFDGSAFKVVSFRNVRFLSDVSFVSTEFGLDFLSSDLDTGPFFQSEIAGRADFRWAHIKGPGGLMFKSATFRSSIGFEGAHGSVVKFDGVVFGGPISFAEMKVDRVELLNWSRAEADMSFRYVTIGQLNFREVTAEKNVDLSGANIFQKMSFVDVSFKGDLRFDDALLPTEPFQDILCFKCRAEASWVFSEVSFEKGLFLNERQFFIPHPWWRVWGESEPRFRFVLGNGSGGRGLDESDPSSTPGGKTKVKRFWLELEKGFANAGALRLQNYSTYQRYVLLSSDADPFDTVFDRLSRWSWGYQLKPARLIYWLIAIIILFSIAHFIESKNRYRERVDAKGVALAFASCIELSIKTTFQPKFNSRSFVSQKAKLIARIQWSASMVLFACFIYSLSKYFPVLNEIIKKLMP